MATRTFPWDGECPTQYLIERHGRRIGNARHSRALKCPARDSLYFLEHNHRAPSISLDWLVWCLVGRVASNTAMRLWANPSYLALHIGEANTKQERLSLGPDRAS